MGFDEPEILSYAISPFCPTSADGLHYETSACFDGFYCFVGVRKATSDVVCDDYERTVFNFRKNPLDPLRHIPSDANENRVILQVVQSSDIVTLMLAYIDSPASACITPHSDVPDVVPKIFSQNPRFRAT
jgi:hypothetical protein